MEGPKSLQSCRSIPCAKLFNDSTSVYFCNKEGVKLNDSILFLKRRWIPVNFCWGCIQKENGYILRSVAWHCKRRMDSLEILGILQPGGSIYTTDLAKLDFNTLKGDRYKAYILVLRLWPAITKLPAYLYHTLYHIWCLHTYMAQHWNIYAGCSCEVMY